MTVFGLVMVPLPVPEFHVLALRLAVRVARGGRS